MKNLMRFILIALILVTTGCTVILPGTTTQTGDTQTLTVSEAAPAGRPVKVTIGMGGGKFNLSSGASKLLEGTIKYNVKEWKPVFTRQTDSLSLVQTNSVNTLPGANIINEWNLKLGKFPMDLTVNAGAYEGKLDLTGLPLTNLTITDGASKAQVLFSSPNPEKMQLLSYRTGASDVKLVGLGNANFTEMSFEGGAGTYDLGFSGQFQRDSNVHITSGVSSITITCPLSVFCKININGALTDVTTGGEWKVDGRSYTNGGSGPTLTIVIDMGLGSLKLQK
jgi:hypothetical protein